MIRAHGTLYYLIFTLNITSPFLNDSSEIAWELTCEIHLLARPWMDEAQRACMKSLSVAHL